jgi:hypothetical protein
MTDQPFAGYPQHYLLGIVDDHDAAHAVVEELEREGISDAQVLEGSKGAEQLDSDGTSHGVFSTLMRTLEQGMSEMDHLGQYEEAVRNGSSVIAAYGEDEDERAKAIGILERHDARFVNYFGALAVELVVR